jgi:hypothetical protein
MIQLLPWRKSSPPGPISPKAIKAGILGLVQANGWLRGLARAYPRRVTSAPGR